MALIVVRGSKIALDGAKKQSVTHRMPLEINENSSNFLDIKEIAIKTLIYEIHLRQHLSIVSLLFLSFLCSCNFFKNKFQQ
jgi:hypothetical protein